MPSNYTENYQLNQWEPEDKVVRTDFNADNAKIDAALGALAAEKADVSALTALTQVVAGKLSLIAGSYHGDGTASRTIALGATPKAVFICPNSGRTYNSRSNGFCMGGLAVSGSPLVWMEKTALQIVSGGFRVSRDTGENSTGGAATNDYGSTYNYIALL